MGQKGTLDYQPMFFLNERHFTPYFDLTFMCVVFALICFSILIKKDYANIKLQLVERKTK